MKFRQRAELIKYQKEKKEETLVLFVRMNSRGLYLCSLCWITSNNWNKENNFFETLFFFPISGARKFIRLNAKQVILSYQL